MTREQQEQFLIAMYHGVGKDLCTYSFWPGATEPELEDMDSIDELMSAACGDLDAWENALDIYEEAQVLCDLDWYLRLGTRRPRGA